MEKMIHQVEERIKNKQRKRLWHRVVAMVSCVVLFITTYAMIFPAIALERECGLEEHAHSEVCYVGEELVCGLEEHSHSDDVIEIVETEPQVETEPEQVEEVPAETEPEKTEDVSAETEPEQTEEVPAETEPEQTEEAPVETEPEQTEDVPAETEPEQTEDVPAESEEELTFTETDSTEKSETLAYVPSDEIGRGTLEGRQLTCNQEHTHAEGCYIPSTFTWLITKNTLNDEYTLTIHGKGEMPDYKRPWNDVLSVSTARHIVIGPNTNAAKEEDRDEITYIGAAAFHSHRILSVSIAPSVHTIGKEAFRGATFAPDYIFNIPGTVKHIGDLALFDVQSIGGVTLNEGTQTIGGSSIVASIKKIHIPSTLSFSGNIFYSIPLAEITVAENNPRMKAIDNVLYYLKDDNTWKVVKYAGVKPDRNFTIPDKIDGKPVLSIDGFQFAGNLLELTVPDVDYFQTDFIVYSSIQKVILKSDLISSNPQPFRSASALQEVTIENLTHIPERFFYASSINKLHIGPATESIGRFALDSCGYLNEVTFDGKEVVFYDTPVASTSVSRFDLTIGPNVDVLNAGFNGFSKMANTVTFKGPNFITIAEGAMKDAPAPFQGLSGDIYVDEKGAVYTLNQSDASLFYCPPGVDELAVPAAISLPGEAGMRPVTTVRQNALKWASSLTSITFEAPATITNLEALAMANCLTLGKVNGFTTQAEAIASFSNPNIQIGPNVFYETALEGSLSNSGFDQNMSGGKEISITNGNIEMLKIFTDCSSWTGDSTGGYKLLTGDQVKLYCSTGAINNTQDTRYRVYLRFTNDAFFTQPPGKTESFSNWEITYHATNDPYIMYAEFGAPPEGYTGGLPIVAFYPNYTRGGGLTVWGVVTDSTASEGSIIDSEQVMQFSWGIQRNDFVLTTGALSTDSLSPTADGKGNIHPNSNVYWWMALRRVEGQPVLEHGKDLVQYVDLRNEMTLPEGITLSEDIKSAISNADVSYSSNRFYAGGQVIAQIDYISAPNTWIPKGSVGWDEDRNTLILSWRHTNTSQTLDVSQIAVNYYIMKEALAIDGSKPIPVGTVIENKIFADVCYAFSTDKLESDTATRNIAGGSSNLEARLSATGGSRLGEDITYTLRGVNLGAFKWTGTPDTPHNFSLKLDTAIYIKPQNMEKMFADNSGTVVTITNAVLGPWRTINGADNKPVDIHVGNSNFTSETPGKTLTVSYQKESGKYLITVNGGLPAAYDSVAEGLKAVGYAVTPADKYTCTIPINEAGTTFSLLGNADVRAYAYATVKNSFQALTQDYFNEYTGKPFAPLSLIDIMVDNKNCITGSYYRANNITKDVSVFKSIHNSKGEELSGNFACNNGDILDHRILFNHYGNGTCEDVPVIDEISGSQYLLVPKAGNSHLPEHGAEDYGNYYILKEGTYPNVVVGVNDQGTSLVATSVVAKKDPNTDGLLTTIHWHFSELPSGNCSMYFDYQTLVSLELTGVNYSINSTTWANDREGSRLYYGFGGGGTLMEFRKDIVIQKGSKPSADILDKDRHSLVGPGDQVIYRLSLINNQNRTFDVNGTILADMLPDTYGQFRWEKNVNVTDVSISTTNSAQARGFENWYLADAYGGILGNHQYVLWEDTAVLTLPSNSQAYIYITLTYPEDEVWDNYAQIINGDSIYNEMYIYRYADSVKHDLRETGRVMLQKGVFGTYYYLNPDYYLPINSREYYNVQDSRNRAVAYYAVILNDANKRLYLSDMYDVLPEGFTYLRMLGNSSATNLPADQVKTLITSGGNSNPFVEIDGDISYRSATITAESSNGVVKFRFSNGTGEHTLHWDAERKEYYLNRNEAIVFGYLCNTGNKIVGNTAVNTLAMPYTDPLGTGTTLSKKSAEAVRTQNFTSNNDGTRYTMTAQKATDLFGVETDVTWLASDVTLHRGGIVPGIQKRTIQYRNTDSGDIFEYKNSVGHSDEVTWKIALHNGGTQAMTNYTLTDILPYPYTLTGSLTYVIKDSQNREIVSCEFMDVPKHIAENGTELSIMDHFLQRNRTVTIGSKQPVAFGQDASTIMTYIDVDEVTKNEILTLELVGVQFSVPEGGSAEFILSAVNPTSDYQYSVYTNQAILVPSQEYTLISAGSPIALRRSNNMGIRATAPVTVSSGFATSSKNEVHFDGKTGSSAPEDKNYVILKEAGDTFEYTLSVTNDISRPMARLVLIDNLPDVGDHTPFDVNTPRDSEFKVSLAENPDFEVLISPKDGTPYTPTNCKIQFSTDTDFYLPQSSHWKGQEDARWTNDYTGARSIRVVINEPIPANAVVTVNFKVKADENAKPGQVAWNSFGYHYYLKAEALELEAMPLAVGAKIASVPKLRKELLDLNGQPQNAAQDAEFTFRVTSSNGTTGEFKVVVPAGKSQSEWTELTGNGWIWEDRQTYTVTEISVPKPYSFGKFPSGMDDAYVFTYDAAMTHQFVCQNVMTYWDIQLTKVDGTNTDTLLSGAQFKLYGLVDNGGEPLTDANGTTWYLYHTGTTDENGLLEWKELGQAQYLLVETKAPDGYMLSGDNQWVLLREDAEEGVYSLEIKNDPGYRLPNTGGMGREWILLAGICLISLAGAGFFLQRKKKTA